MEYIPQISTSSSENDARQRPRTFAPGAYPQPSYNGRIDHSDMSYTIAPAVPVYQQYASLPNKPPLIDSRQMRSIGKASEWQVTIDEHGILQRSFPGAPNVLQGAAETLYNVGVAIGSLALRTYQWARHTSNRKASEQTPTNYVYATRAHLQSTPPDSASSHIPYNGQHFSGDPRPEYSAWLSQPVPAGELSHMGWLGPLPSDSRQSGNLTNSTNASHYPVAPYWKEPGQSHPSAENLNTSHRY